MKKEFDYFKSLIDNNDLYPEDLEELVLSNDLDLNEIFSLIMLFKRK